ncbi:HEPN domain-containing protein [Candidatus Woesearchaeota archaeon]|nr:HEPN domain-containing protein [Candidatus Woesearchaeota archaeon]
MVEIYLNRANNELLAAESLRKLSEEDEEKIHFQLPSEITFYSSVISHSYYSIFYATKAILLTKNIKTDSPEVHKKTYKDFKKIFVDTGLLDVKLLEIYKKLIIRADQLLQVIKDEKWKRGHFTYETIPQANKKPAHDLINNAKFFIANITKVVKKE